MRPSRRSKSWSKSSRTRCCQFQPECLLSSGCKKPPAHHRIRWVQEGLTVATNPRKRGKRLRARSARGGALSSKSGSLPKRISTKKGKSLIILRPVGSLGSSSERSPNCPTRRSRSSTMLRILRANHPCLSLNLIWDLIRGLLVAQSEDRILKRIAELLKSRTKSLKGDQRPLECLMGLQGAQRQRL